MKVWYLSHSGFAVQAGGHLLVFDYYLDTPQGGKLSDGVFRPEDFAALPITVFSSHRHHDHFNRCILGWRQRHSDIRYLLSNDIHEKGKDIQAISPGETVSVRDGLTVRALKSTDEGVAFLVYTPEGAVYHAGDLNWWHWSGESDEYNLQMKANYCGQIDLLRGENIELAFVPADPRLEDQYAWGLDYFMRTVGARRCVPMHLWERYDLCRRLLEESSTQPYHQALISYSVRGEELF